MLGLLRTVAQVANAEATVLLLGETGTGKELIAHALHVNSSRRSRPFARRARRRAPARVVPSPSCSATSRAPSPARRRVAAGESRALATGRSSSTKSARSRSSCRASCCGSLESGEIQRVGSDGQEKVDARVVAGDASRSQSDDCQRAVPRGSLLPAAGRGAHGSRRSGTGAATFRCWLSISSASTGSRRRRSPGGRGAAWDALLAQRLPGQRPGAGPRPSSAPRCFCVDGELDLESLPSEFGGDADGDVPAGDSSSGLDQLKREREAARTRRPTSRFSAAC